MSMSILWPTGVVYQNDPQITPITRIIMNGWWIWVDLPVGINPATTGSVKYRWGACSE